jgi:peptidoglycan/xylan/chitin deacetylase (PgdA/CDA1 family)
MPDHYINIPQDKISISFTWDDNSARHYSLLAPIFYDNGLRCTFYVVPGEQKYDSEYRNKYNELSAKGFEIGSHSFSHQYMTSLSPQEAEAEFDLSVQKIHEQFGVYPLTFAFPNHDYNDTLLKQARKFHLETRNTLPNARRFSIKTHTIFKDLKEAIDEAYSNKINLVFSGHSLITDEEYLEKRQGEGYEPMRISLLAELLTQLKTIESNVDVITFAQSALREWVKKTGRYQDGQWVVSQEQLFHLERFFIYPENIASML